MHGLIVTGISTDVGKTVVSTILAKAWGADYWKPIESGDSDTLRVKKMGIKCHPPLYHFKNPLSPHHAAQLEDKVIDPNQFLFPCQNRLIIEGCGGVMVPYGEGHLGTLFAKWKLPWIVVSKHYLGSINHTLLTLSWLQSHRQKILGVIFNGTPNLINERFVLSYAQVRFLGRLYPEQNLNLERITWYAMQFKEIFAQFGTLLPNV